MKTVERGKVYEEMIVGIGTDLVEVERIEQAIHNQRFVERIYTKREQQIVQNKPQQAAGNYAVKEAVAKMFGTGFSKCAPQEIEVLRDALGKPYINLYDQALLLAKSLQIHKIHVSISNTRDFASAFVIGECLEEKRE